MARITTITWVVLAHTCAAAATERQSVNLAPLAEMVSSAATDGARAGIMVNDGDPETYWSAWPYTMRGPEDVITLDVTFPVEVVAHRLVWDEGRPPPDTRILVGSAGGRKQADGRLERSAGQCVFTLAEPATLTHLRLAFHGIRAAQSGVVIHELQILGELPGRITTALAAEATPDLDWRAVAVPVAVRKGDQPLPSYEARPAEPVAIRRVEMDWRGAGYARRTVLEMELADGQRLFVPRLRFSTAYTFDRPYEVRRIRLWCTQNGNRTPTDLAAMRLYGDGTQPKPPEHPALDVWPETALVKVSPNADGPHERSPFAKGDPLRVTLVRNEYEGGQVVIRNNGSDVLRDVTVEVEPLRSTDGATLSPPVVNPVGYVNGQFADVLMLPGPFRIGAGRVRPVWLTFHAGEDAAAGCYKGQAICRVAGEEVARLPIEVTVADVALTERTHFKTHYFSIWGTRDYLSGRLADPNERDRLLEEIADQFIRHRISPGNPFILEEYEKSLSGIPWDQYVAIFDRWSGRLIDGGLPFVGLLPGWHGKHKGGPQTEEEYWQFWQSHLEEKGWLDKFAIRVGDEPPPGNQRVTDTVERIKRFAPKLKRQCAFSSFGTGGTPSWTGLVDEWGIAPRVYNQDRISDVVEFCRERMAAGDGVSWYVHHVLSLEETPFFPRMFFWRMWKYRLDGALLYGVAEWAHRDVDRWEDQFVIHGTGFNTWGVLLWPAKGHLLNSVRFEAVRDGIEDWELHRLLDEEIRHATAKQPNHPAVVKAKQTLDDMSRIFADFDYDEASQAEGYRIRDIHSDGPYLCTNAVPADMLEARRAVIDSIVTMRELSLASADLPDAPKWAVQYCEGLQAFREIIGYWLDRRKADGTFGFGWGEDCEMIVGWPGVMMAADDKQIEAAIERLADNRWYNPYMQDGYVAIATDPEHGAEPSSYTTPVLLYQKFGSPKLIERLMATASNVKQWTGITPDGHRHMRSTYFGSQQMCEWPYYAEDSPINARAWLPMMHLLMYNRDPYLMKVFLEWIGSWAEDAMAEVYGKPPGILPGTVEFATGEPGGYTKNWWGAGAHEFVSLWYQTRLHGMLALAYTFTGDEKYITPLREMLRFFSQYARPPAKEGEPAPPDRLPGQYAFPDGWRDGSASTQWARDLAWGHPGCWYQYVTGDTQFDEPFSRMFDRPFQRGGFEKIDKTIVGDGWRRATSFRDSYFTKVMRNVRRGGSTANYAAAFWQKHYGTMTFGNRCFGNGGKLTNSVNWPWVDFPSPAVVWKDTGYTTGIFVLKDEPQLFRVELANISGVEKRVGGQLFTLDEGMYDLRFGPDADEDGQFDAVFRTDRVFVERGTIVRIDLPVNVTMLLELRRAADAGEVPPWRSRPDLGLDPWDIMVSKERPQVGDEITVSVRVHNIGSEPAEGVRVVLSDQQGNKLAEGGCERLDPPQELEPSFVDVPLTWTVADGVGALQVQIDPDDTIDELYEGNNKAAIALVEAKSSQPVKKVVDHGPAARASLDDVDEEKVSRREAVYREGIAVDGVISDEEWRGVDTFELIPHAREKPLQRRTWMQVAYDDEALYVALRCEEPEMEHLSEDLSNTHQIYYNDGFEIFLDPGCDVWRYWQFVFDTAGHKLQVMTRNMYAPKVPWDVAVHKNEAEWSAEVRFPYEGFVEWDIAAPEAGSRWRMNVCRYTTTIPDEKDPSRRRSERSHFSPKGRLHSHHQPELFGDIYFKPH